MASLRAVRHRFMRADKKGFTLVEMLVVAPIVILSIGAFITLIVSLTGEVMSSRGSNVLAYNIQDTLSRIEEDVRLSAAYLAKNDIAFTSSNPQGRNTGDTLDTTTDFTLVDPTYGQSLILKSYVTSGNPVSLDSGLLYLANKPSACDSYEEYAHNAPMAMNIVYFVDDHDTLWRRVIMPPDYADSNTYCGSDAPWQQPSCIDKAGRSAFCKTNDQKMLENVGKTGFTIDYFTSASSTTPLTITSGTDSDSLRTITTIGVSILATDTIAGREVSRTGQLRVSRLDLNAAALSELHAPEDVPSAPIVTGSVSEGHNVTFSWPVVATATGYKLQYRVNGGAWSSEQSISNTTRKYKVTNGWNGDTVEARVTAQNAAGSSAITTISTPIPLWMPLILTNGWVNYESTYADAAYTRTREGVVMLKGLIKSGVIGDIATLPPDYRPDKSMMFENSSNQAPSRLDIRANGVINMPVGSNPWASLDGVNFMAGNAYTDLTSFTNNWKNYGGDWANAGYAVDGHGRVHTRGLVSSGTIADGTDIISYPTALMPAGYMHVSNNAANAHGLIGIPQNSPVLEAKGYTNSYLGLNAMFYPASARATGTNCSTQWCALPMQNGWQHYGSPFTTPQYTKGSDNIVIVKGLINNGNTSATIASLPQGFCPAERLLMTTGSYAGWARVDIVPGATPAAGCTIVSSAVNAIWTSLDSVIFMAEQ